MCQAGNIGVNMIQSLPPRAASQEMGIQKSISHPKMVFVNLKMTTERGSTTWQAQCWAPRTQAVTDLQTSNAIACDMLYNCCAQKLQ